MSKNKSASSRRNFLKNTLKGTAGAALVTGFPTIVPASVLGPNAPSNRINVGAIGIGRIARDWDIPGTIKHDITRVLAVSDVDTVRLQAGKKYVDDYYIKKGQSNYNSTKTYEHYEELLADKDIDAVIIATPDHWHVLPAIQAVRAGKHVYMEKPASLCISEGRILSDEVQKSGKVLQVGSQQRSMPQFKKACELVRNGRIGKLHTIYVGLPIDKPEESTIEKEMPVPSNLNFEKWLGATPYVPYTEKLVHPQKDYSRPGWLRCEQFGAGMITGWGSHHFDIANWGMGTENTGPIEISGTADWPDEKALWDVHGNFKTETLFANGVKVLASNEYPNGVKFVGSEGWIFVTRGNYSVTASDPVKKGSNAKALDASNPKILDSVIGGPNEIKLIDSTDHHLNWLNSITTGQANIAPIEAGHRACSVCLLNHGVMKLKRKLYWDPVAERFKNDDEANSMLVRAQRWPYQISPGFNIKTTVTRG